MERSRNVSRVFGVEFENLMADIERNLTKFSAPPVGPVGRHVKLVGQATRDQGGNSIEILDWSQWTMGDFFWARFWFIFSCGALSERKELVNDKAEKTWRRRVLAKLSILTIFGEYG